MFHREDLWGKWVSGNGHYFKFAENEYQYYNGALFSGTYKTDSENSDILHLSDSPDKIEIKYGASPTAIFVNRRRYEKQP